jgi:uncharacterized membrane protein
MPPLLSYVLSFVYIGIYWVNHHHLLQLATQVDRRVLWANLHLLFWLSLLPFVTSWVANHHRQSAPVACYGVVLLMCSVAFLLLKRALRHSEAAHPSLAALLGHGRKNALSILLYAVAIPLSLATPLGRPPPSTCCWPCCGSCRTITSRRPARAEARTYPPILSTAPGR